MNPELVVPPLGMATDAWECLPKTEKVLLIAIQEVRSFQAADSGAAERIDQMLRASKSFPGQPWSAAFVTWCLTAVGATPRLRSPASVFSWIEITRGSKMVSDRPRRGDLFFIDKPGIAHLGFVAGVKGDRIACLEGNIFVDGRFGGPTAGLTVRQSKELSGFISLRKPNPISAAFQLAA